MCSRTTEHGVGNRFKNYRARGKKQVQELVSTGEEIGSRTTEHGGSEWHWAVWKISDD